METERYSLPMVSTPQDIGHRAYEEFIRIRPESWIVTGLDGDKDFGIDAQVQLKTGNGSGKICHLFHTQIKGGEVSFSGKDYIYVDLYISSLNYFHRITSIVLFVYVDFSESPAKTYFVPIHEEIIKNIGDALGFPQGGKTKRIKISKENILNQQTNISTLLDEYTKQVISLRASIYRQGGFKFLGKENTAGSFDSYIKDWKPERNVSDEYFMRAEEKIRLEAFLPLYPQGTVSCLILLSLPGLQDCMITLSGNNLIKTLFQANLSPPILEGREFIVGRPCLISQNYMLQLGSCRFFAPPEVVEELCETIDDFADEYLSRIQKIESLVGAETYPLSASTNLGYKVIRIPRWLWARIQGLAEDFRYDKGTNEWHIFDYDNYALRIVGKDSFGNIVEHAILSPEYVESYAYSSSEVWLVWLPPHDRYGEVVIDHMWDIPTTFDFLVFKLIPKAYEYFEKPKPLSLWSRLFGVSQNSKIDFETKENYERLGILFGKNYLFSKSISNSNKGLLQLCQDMQNLFHNSYINIYLNNEGRKRLYQGLAVILEICGSVELGYLHGNLNITAKTSPDAAKEIRQRAVFFDSGTTNYTEIDLVLRSYIYILKTDLNLPLNTIEKVLNHLKETIDLYQRTLLVKKYSHLS